MLHLPLLETHSFQKSLVRAYKIFTGLMPIDNSISPNISPRLERIVLPLARSNFMRCIYLSLIQNFKSSLEINSS